MQLKVSRRQNLQPVEISLTGAKNALLHLMFAALLPKTASLLHNVPTGLRDYRGVRDILSALGAKVDETSKNSVEITPSLAHQHFDVPIQYSKKTRTSLMLLGVLAKRVKSLKIGYPGGCSFSDERPFDIHLDGLTALGASVMVSEYHVEIRHTRDVDAEFTLKYPSVGASINLMFYAATGKASVHLHNIALEPEVIEVASYLNQCGAMIRIDHNTRSMHIQGVSALSGVHFSVMYDRIQTMSYAALAYLHKVNVTVYGVSTKEYIDAPLKYLSQMGAKWQFDPARQSITFSGKGSVLEGARITARPYPDFPTDLQPIFAVMLSLAVSPSVICDTVYPERVKYVEELQKLGLPLALAQGTITVTPLNRKRNHLHAARLKSFDLRAGMALVMAASLSDQVCYITHAEQIFRGYENLLENMTHFMHITLSTEHYAA